MKKNFKFCGTRMFLGIERIFSETERRFRFFFIHIIVARILTGRFDFIQIENKHAARRAFSLYLIILYTLLHFIPRLDLDDRLVWFTYMVIYGPRLSK